MTDTASGAGVRRAARLLMALAGHEVDGVSNSQLAAALGCNEGTSLRTLQVLADEGLAEQIAATRRWRLGPRLVQVAVAFSQGVERAESRLTEVRQRFTRTPH